MLLHSRGNSSPWRHPRCDTTAAPVMASNEEHVAAGEQFREDTTAQPTSAFLYRIRNPFSRPSKHQEFLKLRESFFTVNHVFRPPTQTLYLPALRRPLSSPAPSRSLQQPPDSPS